MQPRCLKEVSQACLSGCCPSPILGFSEPLNKISKPRSTSATCRQNFAKTTTSSIFPNTHFTNPESLPSLQESFNGFIEVYPQYSDTYQVDQTRAQEYNHLALSNHTCLDYIGIGLFSYAQLQKLDSEKQILPSASSPPQNMHIPFFSVSYKTGNLKTQLLHGGQESALESAMKKRIMSFLNISENDYSMVFTANRTSAFKLLAESYPFKTSRKLLTVYDYESEAVEAMINSSDKKGAQVMSAEFSWPRLRIQSAKLRKMVEMKSKRKKTKRGLFVFPLHSRMTGARYPYLWMNIAKENGWHILIDACALGPKDMDSFGLSLIRPDFLICSFYKIFGENPSGFGCLFVKKSTVPLLEDSVSAGMVSLVPANKMFRLVDEFSGTDSDFEHLSKLGLQEDELDSSNSFSGPISSQTMHSGRVEQGETSESQTTGTTAKQKVSKTSDIVESGKSAEVMRQENGILEIECRGLDQVDSLGLTRISNRARCLINWMVNALLKLKHPNTGEIPLVRIYGPRVKFDRGPALAFNLFDWKGEKVEAPLVQKLADRSNISLSYGFLHHISFSDEYEEEKATVLEKRVNGAKGTVTNKRKEKADFGITVVTVALGVLANFEDTYRFWAFIAQFLDADFVEKAKWRYTALNQKTVEV
ncbi:hypothetical protein POPTR_015G137900v4 [Populus trichocarpa]|uniref:Uncharacterized protein n=2 Tax=Populus trichocarpa TaxID=3694 RepID=A0ACC0RWF4_POPTR|nr:uncharacterized protein LOC7474018 [Populus trichocarpa]KAI5563434.1 hypothetical protein BDE02_15G118500 [Populus trichocarpa]KAI9381598.1 hypothetical protein POPTR_015G137900v4 [Populus trichocarpa]|eukprot:XP_002321884.1 uncharacterized protein LOC7474018 [Populus trichocarpa]